MRRDAGSRIRAIVLVLACLVALLAAGATPGLAQGTSAVPELDPAQRVYDETGASLDAGEVAELERQIEDLDALGASVIVYVRALDATPAETLAQVEALQQAWVEVAGVDQDTAVAILINRNPDDANDARAGIFVGRTYNEGNVPEGEQRAIVEDALIPPLRDGDVYGSFAAGLERLENSILHGPPRNAFERFADRVAESWFPWVTTGLAAALGGLAAWLFRKRQHLVAPALPPTTVRPGNLTPALGSALAGGGPQATAFPATILDLAGRGALAIEPESTGGRFSEPKIQVRLLNQDVVTDDVEAAVWHELERRAKVGIVSSKDLGRIAASPGDIRKVLDAQMQEAGWKDQAATGRKVGLGLVSVAALGLAILAGAVAGAAGSWLPVIGTVAMGLVAIASLVMLLGYSSLSLAGQEAARPWIAYREGLKDAAGDRAMALDLNETLPDIVAFGQGSRLDDRLKDAAQAGAGLRIFQHTVGGRATGAGATGAYFPFWVAFNSSVTAPSSSSSGGTVSGGGAGGGGGAAGST